MEAFIIVLEAIWPAADSILPFDYCSSFLRYSYFEFDYVLWAYYWILLGFVGFDHYSCSSSQMLLSCHWVYYHCVLLLHTWSYWVLMHLYFSENDQILQFFNNGHGSWNSYFHFTFIQFEFANSIYWWWYFMLHNFAELISSIPLLVHFFENY